MQDTILNYVKLVLALDRECARSSYKTPIRSSYADQCHDGNIVSHGTREYISCNKARTMRETVMPVLRSRGSQLGCWCSCMSMHHFAA